MGTSFGDVLSYVERGYGVFPCIGRTKKPRFRKGTHEQWAPPGAAAGLARATWDCRVVERHWPADPNVASGLVPPEGVAFLDADEKHRAGIVHWLLGKFPHLAKNGVHSSPSNGAHIPVAVPDGLHLPQTVDPAVGIDTRVALKGYVIAPPAPGYRVAVPFQAVSELRPIPKALVDLLAPKAHAGTPASVPSPFLASPVTPSLRRYVWRAVQGEHDNVAAAPEGARNRTLHVSAIKLGSLVGAGVLDLDDARESLIAGVHAAEKPLPIWEARRTIESGLKYGMAHPRHIEGPDK